MVNLYIGCFFRIGCGLAYSFCKTLDGKNEYGIVAEVHGNYTKIEVKKRLKEKLKRMAEIRKLKLGKIVNIISHVNAVSKEYGCVVCVLVFR